MGSSSVVSTSNVARNTIVHVLYTTAKVTRVSQYMYTELDGSMVGNLGDIQHDVVSCRV
jgi:hypothetical protein